MMKVVVAVALLGMATPVYADAFDGAAKIARGDYAAAERDLVAQRALYPDNVGLMLNLAAVYAHTGRPVLARAIYQRVAMQPDEGVVVASGAALSSRAVAAAGLAQVPALVAAR